MSGVRTPAQKARAAMSHAMVSRAFRGLFKLETKAAQIVLAFLADLTFATESTVGETPRETEMRSAKREIWLAINNVLRLSEQDIRDMQERVATWKEAA